MIHIKRLHLLCTAFMLFFSCSMYGGSSSVEKPSRIIAKYSLYEVTEDFFIQKSRFTEKEVKRIRLEDIICVKKKVGFPLGLEISRFFGVLTLFSAFYFIFVEKTNFRYDGSFKANIFIATPFVGLVSFLGWWISFSCYCLSFETINGEEIAYRFYFSIDEIAFMNFIKRANRQIVIRKQKRVGVEESLNVVEKYLVWDSLCYELTDEFFIDKTGSDGTELRRIKLEDIKSAKKKRVIYPVLIVVAVFLLISFFSGLLYRLIEGKWPALDPSKNDISFLEAIYFFFPPVGILFSVSLYFVSYRVSLEMMNGKNIVLAPIFTGRERLEDFIKLLHQQIDLVKKQKETRAHPQQVEAADKKQENEVDARRREADLLERKIEKKDQSA